MKVTLTCFKALPCAAFFFSFMLFSTLISAKTTDKPTNSPTVAALSIATLSPATVAAGSGSVTVTVTGTNFRNASSSGGVEVFQTEIFWGGNGTDGSGSFHSTTIISSSQLTFVLTALEVATIGTFKVQALNDGTAAFEFSNFLNFIVAPACSISTAATSTNWTSVSTWGACAVPTGSTNARIPTGITVTLDANASVNNLTIEGTGKLLLSGNTLTINGTLTTNGSLGFIAVTNNNPAGKIIQTVATGVPKLFPIGTLEPSNSTYYYSPFTITLNQAGSVSGTAYSIVDLTPLVPNQTIPTHWNITAPASSVATLTFSPAPAIIAAFTASTGAAPTNPGAIGHFNTTTNTWGEYLATYSAGTGTWTVSGYNGGFSPFAVGNAHAFAASVLSVDLKSITAVNKGTVNTIEWTTASEKDNTQFSIERSTNGLDFQSIGAIKGHGTTNQENVYTFEDRDPSVNMNYYRLQTLETGGQTTYSKVVSVKMGKGNTVKIYPTVVQDKLTVTSESPTEEQFDIINLLNQIVLTGICGGQKELQVGQLPTGAYVLRMSNQSIKFVKQ